MTITHNDKTYIDITDQFYGNTLDYVVKYLEAYKESNKLAATKFNGVWLYSDTVTLDDAYKSVTGNTKEEFDAIVKAQNDKFKKEEEEFMSKKDSLELEWIEKGHEVLDEKYWEKWDECVPIRLDDLYHGMELGCCLEIIKALNEGCEISHALKLMEKQNHSGMSWSLVRSMIYCFCDRGPEFAERAV